MSKLSAFYLFSETHANGTFSSTKRIELHEIKRFLKKEHDIPVNQIENALKITADNPGVPYDLYKPNIDDSFGWTARLTLKVQYWG